MNLGALDESVFASVTSYLSPYDLARSRRVCQEWKSAPPFHGYNPIDGVSVRPLIVGAIAQYARTPAYRDRMLRSAFREGQRLGEARAGEVIANVLRCSMLALQTPVLITLEADGSRTLVDRLMTVACGAYAISIGWSLLQQCVTPETRARAIVAVTTAVAFGTIFGSAGLHLRVVTAVALSVWYSHQQHMISTVSLDVMGDSLVNRVPRLREGAGCLMGVLYRIRAARSL